jgi:hypothetical protein
MNIRNIQNSPNVNFSGVKFSKDGLKEPCAVVKKFLQAETETINAYRKETGDKTLKTPAELIGEINAHSNNDKYNIMLHSQYSYTNSATTPMISIETPEGDLINTTPLFSGVIETPRITNPNNRPLSLFNIVMKSFSDKVDKLNGKA